MDSSSRKKVAPPKNKEATIAPHTGGSLEVTVIVKAICMIYEMDAKGTRATAAAMVTESSAPSIMLDEDGLWPDASEDELWW